MNGILTTEAASLPIEQIAAALAEHHPAVHAAIVNGQRTAGASAECERIKAVRAQALPGHEALIEQLAFDGKTTGPEAAVAVLNAERAIAAKRAADLAADAPPPLKPDASATGDTPPDKKPAAKDPMADAQALANAIAKVQAEHAAAGRSLSAVQALAIVNQQEA